MERKIFLSLFITLCGCFPQVIGTRENVDIHVRKKRIIDLAPGYQRPSSLHEVPYIVRILENGNIECGGSILSPDVVLTAAHCVIDDSIFHVESGSASIKRGERHNITRKIIYNGYIRSKYSNDLALLLIESPIHFLPSFNQGIKIFNGHLPRNSMGTISGWGCNSIEGERRQFPTRLHSITVPIISQKACEHHYQHLAHLAQLSEKEICTLDPKAEKGCSFGDSGAPLVVNGRLLGVLAFTEVSTHPRFPAVFADLRFQPYRDWILRHVPHAI